MNSKHLSTLASLADRSMAAIADGRHYFQISRTDMRAIIYVQLLLSKASATARSGARTDE